VGQLLDSLPEREAEILRLRFYDELTQTEIADRIGISQMHVSRLIRRCLLDLRETLDR
jgi:RNA polymerase sigma-B factor